MAAGSGGLEPAVAAGGSAFAGCGSASAGSPVLAGAVILGFVCFRLRLLRLGLVFGLAVARTRPPASAIAATSAGGALRKRPMSKCAAMRTGSATRSARPSAAASSASNQVSFSISAAISASSRPDFAA